MSQRLIKFRAWDKPKKMILPVAQLHYNEHLELGGVTTLFRTSNPVKATYQRRVLLIEDVELMQFTGLLDKSGKEIFNSDILSFEHGEQNKENTFYKSKEAVYAKRGGFVVCGRNAQGAYTDEGSRIKNFMWCQPGHMSIPDIYHEVRNVEVIGNIYENPELI